MFDYRTWSIGVGIALVVLSFLPANIDGPQLWLTEWTKWLAIYVGIAVSARGIWTITDELANRIRGSGIGRQKR